MTSAQLLGAVNQNEREYEPAGTNGIVVLRFADKEPKDKDGTVLGVTDAEHRPKIWINIPEGGPEEQFCLKQVV